MGCLVTTTACAQNFGLDSDDKDDGAGLPATEMLVEGSILQKILIPQYDEQHRLSSVFRADKLVLVNDRTIDAETVRLEFYHPNRTLRAGIDLATARLHNQNLLRSSDPVSLQAEDLEAEGTGLVYELDRSRGFLFGPATARTLIDIRTSMNTPSIPPLRAGGITLLAAAALHAQGPDTLSETEIQGLDRLAVSRAAVAGEAAARAEGQLERTGKLTAEADASLKDFLSKAAVGMEDGPKPDLTSKVPEPEPDEELKLPASIKAKKGIFFDSASGILIFLENVEINHPEFTLLGADEVKVFMEKPQDRPDKTEPDQKQEKEDKELFADAKFGDPTRIVATGTVVVERIDPGDGRKIKASGRQMVLDLTSNELIIRGGEPWIISPQMRARMVDPDGYFMMNMKTGDASAVGRTEALVESRKDN